MRSWILAGAGLGALVLASIAAPAVARPSAGSGTAVPAACSVIANPYSQPKSLLRTCGYQVYPLRRVIGNTDGSRTYVYQVAGHAVTSVMPPRGFDALKASNAELRRYGLPTRSMIGAGKWRQLMSHLSIPAPRPFLLSYANGPRFTFSCHTCWAGYQADKHSDYYEALGSFNEPSVHKSSCPSPQLEGVWVGLGDDKSTIGQTGTSDGTGVDHLSFFEVIGPGFNGKPIFAGRVKVGDSITAYATYPSGEGAYTFTVMDKSKVVLDFDVTTSIYQGKLALFVVEDPARKGGSYYLSDFGKVKFTSAKAVLVGHLQQKLGSFPHSSFIITDSKKKKMATTGSLSKGKSFTVSYQRCD